MQPEDVPVNRSLTRFTRINLSILMLLALFFGGIASVRRPGINISPFLLTLAGPWSRFAGRLGFHALCLPTLAANADMAQSAFIASACTIALFVDSMVPSLFSRIIASLAMIGWIYLGFSAVMACF